MMLLDTNNNALQHIEKFVYCSINIISEYNKTPYITLVYEKKVGNQILQK